MKKYLLFIALLTFCTNTNAQKVIGVYHSQFYNQNFNVELDCKEAKFDGKDIGRKEYPNQIYLQVHTNEGNKKAYIQLSNSEAKNFGKKLLNTYNKMQRWAEKAKGDQKKADEGEVKLFFSEYDKVLACDNVGRETGQDYAIYFIKDAASGRIYFKGEEVKNEGKIPMRLSGWDLVIASLDEIKQIEELLNAAVSLKK